MREASSGGNGRRARARKGQAGGTNEEGSGYWELFGNIREHKHTKEGGEEKHKRRGKRGKVGKSEKNLLLLPDTRLGLRHGAHTSCKHI